MWHVSGGWFDQAVGIHIAISDGVSSFTDAGSGTGNQLLYWLLFVLAQDTVRDMHMQSWSQKNGYMI